MKYILLLIPFFGLLITAFLLNLIGIRFFVITSGSMEPQLKRGDIIFTSNQSDYSVGNVVSYLNNDKVVTHQIIAKHNKDNKSTYRTKGSANKLADSGLVESSEIIGRVFHAIPKIGLLFLLPKKLYIIALIWVMSGAIVTMELRQLIESIQQYSP